MAAAAKGGGGEEVPPNGRFHGHRLLDFLAQLGNSFAARRWSEVSNLLRIEVELNYAESMKSNLIVFLWRTNWLLLDL